MQITQDTIERLKRDVVATMPADKHIVAVLPRTFTVNGATVDRPVGMYGTTIHAEMTVVLASHDNITNLDRVPLARAAADGSTGEGDVERIYIPRQLALADMALTPSEQQLGVVLVDMGSETTTISIHRQGALQAIVTLPMGGRNITRDIATGLSITEEQAEYIKVSQASAIPDPRTDTTADAREVSSYTQARAGEIIANVLHRIEQAGFKNADLPAGIVLTGRASRMRRMTELFETQTQMRVRTAPADNRVSPGNTGVDPIDSLDIMSLIAWPLADDDADCLSELPKAAATATDADTDYLDDPRYRTSAGTTTRTTGGWRTDDDLDDDNLLRDDDEVERKRRDEEERRRREEERLRRRREQNKSTNGLIDEEEEEYPEDETEHSSRFGKLRDWVTGIGKGFIGSRGPEDIDD